MGDEQRNDLQALEKECDQLEHALAQEMERLRDCEGMAMQKLQLQAEVEVEQIGHLQQMLERQRVDSNTRDADGPAQPPGTAQLQSEAERLRAELSQKKRQGEQELAAMQTYADDLRLETKRHEEEYRNSLKEKGEAERALEELRQRKSSGASSEREHAAELLRKDSLTKELDRSKRRLEFLENKILQLEDEDRDIRQRASLVQGFGASAPDGSPDSERADMAQLQEIVQHRQLQLQRLKRQEEALQDEMEGAQLTLEAANVEASVLQQKMKLLHSRITSTPSPVPPTDG